jgi:hypothetical protein
LLLDLLRSQFVRPTAPDRDISADPVARDLFQLLPGIIPQAPDGVVSPLLDPETHKRRLFTTLTHYFLLHRRQSLFLGK